MRFKTFLAENSQKINGIENGFKCVAFLTRFYAFESSGRILNFAYIKKWLITVKTTVFFRF